uniref:AB hydrolase-1 domain-containing protein n=1 Tax=Pseudo-nitzschia australis TaxID=44445 RepID=A0A7S4ATG7_9STRA|mmetsp:Transcript_24990/g.54800  ORF Transcript_24990/g.54800 Transcript_24990/m.54800 type:complete len:402 (+) Transcript_24990:119-1324(+)
MESLTPASKSSTSSNILSVSVLTALAVGALGATVALAATAISRKTTTNTSAEKAVPLPCAPIGSKFVTLPGSGINLRYTDSDDKATENSRPDDETSVKQLTLLMLHGFAGVLETWELMTPQILELYNTAGSKVKVRVVALDLVGSGFSDKPIGTDFDYTLRSQGKVVSEFISVLGLSNVVIVSFSAGTVVGAAVATEQHDLSQSESDEVAPVVGLVFAGGCLFRAKSSFYSKRWLKPIFHWVTAKLMTDRKQSLAKFHHPAHAERVLTDDLVEHFVAPTRLPNFNAALVETVMAKEAPYEELVDKLLSPPSTANKAAANPLPMLFVWGNEDTYKPLPQLQIDSIRQKLDAINASSSPQQQQQQRIVETKELEECHHYIQHDQPEALAKEIFLFVNKNVKLQ